MKWVIVLGVIILLPFMVYVLSKVQMAGWLNALKQQMQEMEEKEHGKETEE
jgi:Tfp pilus assembly protein PilO